MTVVQVDDAVATAVSGASSNGAGARVGSLTSMSIESGRTSEELTRRNIVSKVRSFASGRVKGGGPYSVGALAHFLKNRFYIGEVVYRAHRSGDLPSSEPCAARICT